MHPRGTGCKPARNPIKVFVPPQISLRCTMSPNLTQIVAAALLAIAIAHTFATRLFERLARRYPDHAGVWHLLGEVEVVFGFWAMALVAALFALEGSASAIGYLDSRNFTEPLFVFAIMVVAATRPILRLVDAAIHRLLPAIPLPRAAAFYVCTLTCVPLLGSLITEPAAMTLAALTLRTHFFEKSITARMKYFTLAVLFVNVSIGGVLTPYAAPPVLMVAHKWGWDFPFMFTTFGWKAACAVLLNAALATALFRAQLKRMDVTHRQTHAPVPIALTAAHLMFLIGIVAFAHHPPLFLGLLLLFLGVAHAYRRHQDRLILREGLLVAFFLAGLVVLGGQQEWWLRPLLVGMHQDTVFFGAVALTAVTDNAALTYLASMVEGLSSAFQYALVAGAVAGGGLTVIANAPNPAGLAILRGHFTDDAVSPWRLLVAALLPTAVAMACFKML